MTQAPQPQDEPGPAAVARRRLRPDQVWLIGVPLNLLLAVACAYPVAFLMLAAQVVGGELGWVPVESSLVDDGVGIVLLFCLAPAVFAGLVVFGLNALFAFRAPELRRSRYWLAVVLLIVVPDVLYWYLFLLR